MLFSDDTHEWIWKKVSDYTGLGGLHCLRTPTEQSIFVQKLIISAWLCDNLWEFLTSAAQLLAFKYTIHVCFLISEWMSVEQ